MYFLLSNKNWNEDFTYYMSNISDFTDKFNFKSFEELKQKAFPMLNSIIHMHVNRMFRTKQRKNECVIYYLLLKYYKSQHKLEELQYVKA